MTRILLMTLIIISLLRSVAAPALAAPSIDNPGKGHPAFDRFIFVHYTDNFAKKGDRGNSAPQLFSYSGYHWGSSNVPYWINPDSSRVSETDAINGIKASFETWQDDPLSPVIFAYQGATTTFVPGLNVTVPDYYNVVGWSDLSGIYPNAIAVTVVWATRGNKLIIDSDTALNMGSSFAWTQTSNIAEPNTAMIPPTVGYDVDVQNIMTHEAGHWLQLNDLYSSQTIEQTMYGYAGDCELKKRSLESGDLAGIQKIYR